MGGRWRLAAMMMMTTTMKTATATAMTRVKVTGTAKATIPIAAILLAQRELMIVVWRSVPQPKASSHDPVILCKPNF